MSKSFSVSQSQIDKRKKLLEKMQNQDMATSSVPVIEEQKQPRHEPAYSVDDGQVSTHLLSFNEFGHVIDVEPIV